MTHHPADARPSCMVAALDTIKAAQKLKLEPGQKNRVREALPDLYWSLIAEAAIYADLARADYATGIGAGAHMTERDARTEERRERVAEAIRRKQNPRFAEGHRVRVNNDVMDGKYAGRLGTVTKVGVADGAGWIEVALDQMEGLRYRSSTDDHCPRAQSGTRLMAGQSRQNVAIFNPLVLPLPNWHPDGPDGAVDGYVIPFVMPPAPGRSDPNRGAQLRVYPTDWGWRAALRNCFDHAETAEQARAFAAAWIRAAEVLEAVKKRAADDAVVDAEVVEDDDDPPAGCDGSECDPKTCK